MPAYPPESWILEGIYLGESRIYGQGAFTSHPIAVGTVVIQWGGTVFTGEQLRAELVRPHTYVGIGPDLYLANPQDRPPSLDDYMNHSCHPNLWMADEVSLRARRDIVAGEELTADYAMWLNNPNYVMKRDCNCRSPLCRTRITGLDWKLPDLQRRYHGHFSPFINDLISNQNTHQ